MRILIAYLFFFSTAATALAEEAPASESAQARAEDEDIRSIKLGYNVIQENRDLRFNIGIYWQISQFQLDGRTLQGAGPEVLFGYAFNPKLSANFGISQALDTAEGLSALFTGLRTALSYALKGSAYAPKAIVSVNGTPTYSILPTSESMLAAEVGLEQIFLNGSNRVSPATGFSVGGRYDFALRKMRVSTMARYGSLKISSDPVTLMVFGVGLVYRF